MDKFDSYMEEWAKPLPEAPAAPPPEAVPMEKTVLVDLASEVENKKTYLENDAAEKRLARKEEGTLAPPVDVYEPGFRSDLYAAIKDYWRKQKATRDRVQRVREKTGIGRYF